MRKPGPRPLFTVWRRGARSHERIIRIVRIIRFIKIIGLICIIRIVSTISQNLISPGRARRPLRAPGRQGPKNGHFTKGFQKELASFGPLRGPRKPGQAHFLQLQQHVSTISFNAPLHRWPTSEQIPLIARQQCRSPKIHSQASVSLLLRLYPLPLPLSARLLLPQFLLLFLLFLLNPRPPGAEWLVGTREALRINCAQWIFKRLRPK